MALIADIYKGLLTYDGKDIVIVIDDTNESWFYAIQVAKILEYDNNSTNKIIKHFVDPENKVSFGTIKMFAKYYYDVQGSSIFINQACLYELILRSKKPIAVEFRKWITSEVIPVNQKIW